MAAAARALIKKYSVCANVIMEVDLQLLQFNDSAVQDSVAVCAFVWEHKSSEELK